MVLKGGWGGFLPFCSVCGAVSDAPLSHSPLGTTFKGKYGCVDYWVKALLERPSFPTQQVKKRFEVMDPVDVNTPELLVGLHCPHPPPFPPPSSVVGLGGVRVTPVSEAQLMGFAGMKRLVGN